MVLDKYQKYAPAVLRIGIALLLLWFGLTNIFKPQMLVGYLPQWFPSQLIASLTFMVINGIFETILGVALLVGFLTRFAALLATLHIAAIGISLGYNDIAVRDIGLAIAAFSIFLYGHDTWCIEKRVRIR